MHALHGLRKLHLIADKNDVPGSTCHGDEVAKRYLSCFIDEHIVVGPALVFAAEMKYRATDKPMLRRSFFRVENGRDVEAPEFRFRVVSVSFLHATETEA